MGRRALFLLEGMMAKFHGMIGFVDYVETAPDVWEEVASEREYSGDIKRKNVRVVSTTTLNDNFALNNQIEIIADPYINQHFPSIRYVNWNGCNWKVTSVEDQFPRLILYLGEVYNGRTLETEQDAP